jgi:ribosomal protein RSM22 (predicted rRNA methylase)
VEQSSLVAVLPDDLAAALDGELARHPQQRLAQSVERLSARYRQGDAATSPILASEVDVAAYAGYRMPATYAAVHAVLASAASLAPDFSPRTQVDVGGGTGAAVWAASSVWPSLTQCTVVEQVADAIGLGRRLTASAASPAVRGAVWRRGLVDPGAPEPEADLVTLSYVLGELPSRTRADAVRWLAGKAQAVALIEPGTPAGYERIRAARAELIALGLQVVAPCPHDDECPISPGSDWCHFAARLPRTPLHRRLKAATLGFEDEKFAYVVAGRFAASRPEARIIRHPKKHKGWVALDLCTTDGLKSGVAVSKKQGARYRDARDAEWGDPWDS